MIMLPNLGTATKVCLILLLLLVASVICVLSLPVVYDTATAACRAIDECDPFLPICAAHANEHQFFYSHCDMLREICLTGKDWKSDFFDHCNVSKL